MLQPKKQLVLAIQEYDFLSCYRVERDPKIKIKLQALHHLQQGRKLCEVADIVLVDERTVRSWLKLFVEFDYEGLIEREGRGRKPRLPPTEEENFKDEIDRLHEEKNGGRVIAEEIQKLLLDRFDCNYSISGVYTLLDRLNIVWISGRSKHPKHSEEAIEQFHTALRLKPGSGVWLLGIGVSLQAVNRPAEAQEAYRRARATNNLSPELAGFADQRMKQLR